ncbi:hypothetical protein PO909_020191 [Leuciscus waleckii]
MPYLSFLRLSGPPASHKGAIMNVTCLLVPRGSVQRVLRWTFKPGGEVSPYTAVNRAWVLMIRGGNINGTHSSCKCALTAQTTTQGAGGQTRIRPLEMGF